MANPTPTPPSADNAPDNAPDKAPDKDEKKKKLTETERLAAAKAELAKLEAANELALTQAKIDSLKNGGKTAGQLKRIRLAEEKRSLTHTFEQGGKKFCKYELGELSFKNGRLMKAGELIDLPYERLPGDTMKAVKAVDPKAKPSFEAAS